MNKLNIKEIAPRIFHINAKSSYDLSMLFLRYQEFYESSSPRFKNKFFTILEFMEYYVENKKDKVFTYPADFVGYNLPSYVIKEVLSLIRLNHDQNFYDAEMSEIFEACSDEDGSPFYLIGTHGNNKIKHEIAHALFYLNQSYKDAMMSLISDIDIKELNLLYDILSRFGYDKDVHIDEAQAYLATGLTDEMFKLLIDRKKFKRLFKIYWKAIRFK
jgi:hypothetical protein